jgi:hypothetical protein
LPISSYRLGSASAVRRFNCDQAAGVLKWMPRVGVSAVLHRGVPESRAPGDSAPDDFDKVPEADVYAKSEAD